MNINDLIDELSKLRDTYGSKCEVVGSCIYYNSEIHAQHLDIYLSGLKMDSIDMPMRGDLN